VLAQHLQPASIAQPLVEQGRVLDVGEQDGDRAVVRGHRPQVRSLAADGRDHRLDRGEHIDVGEALGLEPRRQRPLDHPPHADRLGGVEAAAELLDRPLGVAAAPARCERLADAEPRLDQERAIADPAGELGRALKVGQRLVDAAHRHRQPSEVEIDRALI
jgi:hypothetical protein